MFISYVFIGYNAIRIIDSELGNIEVSADVVFSSLLEAIHEIYSSRKLNIAKNIALFLVFMDDIYGKQFYSRWFFDFPIYNKYFDDVKKYLILR